MMRIHCKAQEYHWQKLPQVSFLSRQKYACRDKTYFCHDKSFVATNIILSRQTFFATSLLLSQQTRVCRDKTRLLSRQKYACCAKNLCHDKHVICRDKHNSKHTFVATTKMILVEALPANDRKGVWLKLCVLHKLLSIQRATAADQSLC